ncbi:MAG: phosphoglycerate dehydrogenase-like enzyme [Myxococcota bacterium]|jgi:phosphoglycerate dehydrogenase-like enzyme
MTDVLRWGRTAYETDAALELERDASVRLGLTWSLREERSSPGDLAGVRALVIPSKVRIDPSVLDRFQGELVLTTTSGYDHIDVEACGRNRVIVARCPEARRDAVVEQALALGASLMRQAPALEVAARKGSWARSDLEGLAPRGLSGATVVVVGLGVIGQRMASVLSFLGASVLGVDPQQRPAGVTKVVLEDALPHADLVTLHCSLTDSSLGILDSRRLAMLSSHAVVVNTARGPLLDLSTAVNRVESGRLRGLASDVFPQEPHLDLALNSRHPAVILTPHSAGYTHDLGMRVAREVSANLTAWSTGRPLPGAIR